MVIHAFAVGDSATLRNLMAPDAFANFDAAIRDRAAKGWTMTTTVVSIDDATIAAAQRDGAAAQVSVRFASKLASVTRDNAGAVVDGSPTEVAEHHDLWTFVRDIRSRDPNWRLDGDPVGTLSLASRSGAAPGAGSLSPTCTGFRDDDHLAAFRCFLRSARLLVDRETGARAAKRPSRGLIEAGRAALASIPETRDQARRFFEARFRPFRIAPGQGLLTGYYEPLVAGSLVEMRRLRLADPGSPARPRELRPRRRARRIP